MSQHFLLSKAARSLSEARVWQMTDSEVEEMFKKIRFADNNGEPYCARCGCVTVYDCRRANGAPR